MNSVEPCVAPPEISLPRRGHEWYFHASVPRALHRFAAPSPIRGDTRVRSLLSFALSRASLSRAAAAIGIDRNQPLASLPASPPLPSRSSFSSIARRGSASLGPLLLRRVRASASLGCGSRIRSFVDCITDRRRRRARSVRPRRRRCRLFSTPSGAPQSVFSVNTRPFYPAADAASSRDPDHGSSHKI